jgi:hypothetical protein
MKGHPADEPLVAPEAGHFAAADEATTTTARKEEMVRFEKIMMETVC